MRNWPAPLLAFLKTRKPCHKADLIAVTLADGSTDRWTTYDQNVTYGGHTWLARGPLVSRSSLSVRNTMEVPQLKLDFATPQGVLYRGLPFRQQILSGILDGATIELDRAFMPTPGDTSLGIGLLFVGKKGEGTIKADLNVTVNGGNVALNQNAPKNVYQTQCPHSFCDAGCTLSEAAFTIPNTVGGGSTPLLIVWGSLPGSPSLYSLGKITMTSGASAGQTRMIRVASNSGITPSYAFDYGVVPGDTFNAVQGCDKTTTRCDSLGNLLNNRSFPFIPQAVLAV